jgi:uncharacterized alkaline shock family protein YloU
VEGHSLISADVVARYAADAAREVDGVSAVGARGRQRGKDVLVEGDDRARAVMVRIALEWGSSAARVGAAVQEGVADYLQRMTGARPASVDVVVSGVGPSRARR